MTEDAAQDWDPAYTEDGESILWSSDRGGTLQVWTARRDGSATRQISSHPSDAQNPGQLKGTDEFIYGSSGSRTWGVYRVSLDGSDDRLLYGGPIGVPYPSPDGRWIAVSGGNPSIRGLGSAHLVFVDAATGEVLPNAFLFEGLDRVTSAAMGRPRWIGDRQVAFLGHTRGLIGVMSMAFDPTQSAPGQPRPLAGFPAAANVESFDISPDGQRAVLSYERQIATVVIVDRLGALKAAQE